MQTDLLFKNLLHEILLFAAEYIKDLSIQRLGEARAWRKAKGKGKISEGRAMLTRQRVVSVLWCQAMKEAALARQ